MGDVIDLGSMERVYTVSEVAPVLRVSKATVRRWASDGVIASFKAGRGLRFKQSALDAYFAAIGFTASAGAA